MSYAISGAAQHFVPAVNEHNIAIFSVDLLGHGTSDGLKGYIPSFQSVCYTMTIVELTRARPGA